MFLSGLQYAVSVTGSQSHKAHLECGWKDLNPGCAANKSRIAKCHRHKFQKSDSSSNPCQELRQF